MKICRLWDTSTIANKIEVFDVKPGQRITSISGYLDVGFDTDQDICYLAVCEGDRSADGDLDSVRKYGLFIHVVKEEINHAGAEEYGHVWKPGFCLKTNIFVRTDKISLIWCRVQGNASQKPWLLIQIE